MNLASATEKSKNGKLSVTGNVSATSAAQESCPKTCPFYKNGCYAEDGPQGAFVTSKLNKAAAAAAASALDVAIAEAAAIDKLSGKRALRLHVVGDCATDETAEIVSAAAARHRAKAGRPVWTYTHAHVDVKRESWGNVSVLASCEKTSELAAARARGYATAVVVSEFKTDKLYVDGGEKILPCPEMTGRAASCEDCRLCWDDARLRAAGITIAFKAHGAKKAKVTDKLIQLA